jgi:hypothetical protein
MKYYPYVSDKPDKKYYIITNDNKVVCKNYTMPANQSYIVSENGELKRSKYGGSIWEEE